MAAALESGRYRANSMVDTSPGYVVVGPKRIEDTSDLGRVSLTTVLSRSSNVGITKIAMSLEADQLWQSMTRFGFGSLTSDRKSTPVAKPSVASEIHQAFDVQCNTSPQVTFHLVFFVNHISNSGHLFIRQVLHSYFCTYLSFLQDIT